MILAGWDSAVVLAEIEEAHQLRDAVLRELRVVARHHEGRATPRSCASGRTTTMLTNAFAPFMTSTRLPQRRDHRRGHRLRPGPRRGDPRDRDARRHRHDGRRSTSATATTCDPCSRSLLARQAGRARRRRPRSRPAPTLAITQARAARLQGRHRARLGLRRRRVLEGHRQARRGRDLADVLGARRCASRAVGPDLQAPLHEALQARAADLPGVHLGSAQRLEVGGRHRRLDRPGRRRPRAAAHRHGRARWATSRSRTQPKHGALQPVGGHHGLLRPGAQEGRDRRHRQGARSVKSDPTAPAAAP